MDVDPKRTALVLIEYQNDFTTEGGTLHEAVKQVMDETGMLENSQRVVDEARKAGATIVHAPISFAPGYGELGDPAKAYGILKGVIDSNSSRGRGASRSATRWRRRRATSWSRASAASTRSRPRISTSYSAAARSTP